MQIGEPGGKPKPKKASEVSVAIEPESIKGIKVNVATIALGSTCLNISFTFVTPSAFAALTYSKFLALKNSALTTPSRDIQLNKSIMNNKIQKLGSTKLEIIISKYNTGNPDHISINLWPNKSTLPP